MHSRIYQLTKEPIPKEEWLTEEDFFDTSFIGAVADYVRTQPETERQDDIEWLMSQTKGVFAIDKDKVHVLPGAKQRYFSEKFNKFKEKTENLTLDEFCNSDTIWELNRLMQEEYTFYVYDEHACWKPLDQFIRDAEEGAVFYIGGIVDYHF